MCAICEQRAIDRRVGFIRAAWIALPAVAGAVAAPLLTIAILGVPVADPGAMSLYLLCDVACSVPLIAAVALAVAFPKTPALGCLMMFALVVSMAVIGVVLVVASMAGLGALGWLMLAPHLGAGLGGGLGWLVSISPRLRILTVEESLRAGRCPRCGYALRPAASAPCPECGCPLTSDAVLAVAPCPAARQGLI